MFPCVGLFRTIPLVVSLLALSWVPQAAAHAVLLERFPAETESMPSAPHELRLRFNEAVTPVSVRVLDASGRSVTGPEDVTETDETVRVQLPKDLSSGSYVVSYRVISADSHPVSGSFVFAVGQAIANAKAIARAAGPSSIPPWTIIAASLRALFYAAFLVGTGGSLFLVFVDRKSAAAGADRRDGLVACAAAAILLAISLGTEGAAGAAAPLGGLLDPAIWRIGFNTTMGESAAVTLLGLAAIVLGLVRHESRFASVAMVAGAMLAALGFGVTGHAATAEPRWLTAPLLVLHVLCAACWAGALAPLYRRLSREPGGVAAPIVARFSRLGLVVVAVLFAAGLVLACVQVRTPSALIATDYGRWLVAKLALASGLLFLAALNKLRLTPALARGAPGAARLLRGSIAVELVLITGVVVATAMLGEATPPRALAEQAHEHSAPARPDGHVTIVATAGGRKLSLDVTPGHPGSNRLAMTFINDDGTAMAPLDVSVWLSSPALGIEPSELEATKVAHGRYAVMAAPLSHRGRRFIFRPSRNAPRRHDAGSKFPRPGSAGTICANRRRS